LDLVEQFSTTLRQELDYAREAKDAERFAASFAGDPYVRVPAVHHELSTAGLAVAGIDRAALTSSSPEASTD
jgi:ubiquinone biosynthesis protein